MGLLNSIVGQVLGSSGGSGQSAYGGLIDAMGGLINNPQTGGLAGLIKTFEQNGLGGVVASWVGTGQNLPISPEQLQGVIGSAQVQEIARKLGMSPEQASGQLAELLPQVVDKLTPNGTVEEGGALGGLLDMFKGAVR